MQYIRFKHTGRHPVTGEFVSKLCEILESGKFYREKDRGPDGYGRLWRPNSKR